MTSTDLAVRDDDARRVEVTGWLAEARHALAEAVAASDPDQVKMIKAQAVTVAEATKQLQLSKEIQFDALEMVRRAERGVGQVIRQGQADGTVIAPGHNPHRNPCGNGIANSEFISARLVSDIASRGELGANGAGIYDLTDDVTDDQFDKALDEAREEQNLSRANVVRKIKGERNGMTPGERLTRIAELAEQGALAAQIATDLGHSEPFVRKLARDAGIDLPAERLRRGTRRRVDHAVMLEQAAIAIAANVGVLQRIDPTQLDPELAEPWVSELKEAATSLQRITTTIRRGLTHG